MKRPIAIPIVLLVAANQAGCTQSAVATDRNGDPAADRGSVVPAGNARFTILTPRLVRMEWSPDGRFEDRASLAFINRRLPVPKFEQTLKDGLCHIETEALSIRYKTDGPFDKDHLEVRINVGPQKGRILHPPFHDDGNLLGTTRTLDDVTGDCPLDPGIISRNGWTCVDDSLRVLLDDNGWAAPRQNPDAVDWYFFAYGHDFKQALADFTAVAGRIPLPPRYTFGSWWSRYWAYTDAELRELVQDFRKHDVPLDVLVVDMDWHLDGWTGYTWNPKYFPDPEGFLRWAHDQGLHVTLNLHPADGVGRHERAFSEFCGAMGLDPKTTDRIPFDCAVRSYMEAYFKLLHHPLEKMGVDFWWIDWQQGTKSKIPGLDPLPWLNYLHWTDMLKRENQTGRRPIIFSRWGGLGGHRYPIQFSGDTHSNWQSLAFQPGFTSTAGNVGCAYWSHDIGGHMPGRVDPELYARWIQWGALSPVLRTHTTKNLDAERRIWKFSPEVFRTARDAFHLRYQLLPYIYTQARACYDTSIPLCRPLYYEWPEVAEAYQHPGEYLFGDSFLAAPVTEPAEPLSGCAAVRVWIPPGEWIHWFTGRKFTGPATVTLQVGPREIPLFARMGAIIPTQSKSLRTRDQSTNPIVLNFFPGDGETRVYEDDGQSPGYRSGQCAWIPVSQKTTGDKRTISIGPVEGSYPGMPTERSYILNLYDLPPVFLDVSMDGKFLPRDDDVSKPGWWYYASVMGGGIRLPPTPSNQKREIIVTLNTQNTQDPELLNGFRGILPMLVRAREMLGNDAVGEFRDEEELLRGLSHFAAQEMSMQEGLLDTWFEMLAEVQVQTPDRNLANRALLRLLGLFWKPAFRAEAPDGSRIAMDFELGTSLCIPRLRELTAEVRLKPSEPWAIDGSAGSQFAGFSEKRPFKLQTRLKSSAGLQTCVVEAALRFRRGEFAMEIQPRLVLLPSINEWWIVGPFDCPFSEALKRNFDPDTKVDLKAQYTGKDGKQIAWQQVQRPLGPQSRASVNGKDSLTDEFFVDLQSAQSQKVSEGVSFAVTYLIAPSDMDVVLALGSFNGVAVRLNGNEVLRAEGGRMYQSRQDRVPLRLNKGVNTLMLKIPQAGRHAGFCVHLETTDGKPVTQVRTTLQP